MAQNAVFGINSNLDTQDIINKMVSLEARSMDLVEAKKQIEQQKLASFQELKNRLQTFKGVVTTLNTKSRFIVNKSVFSNNSFCLINFFFRLLTKSSKSFILLIAPFLVETALFNSAFDFNKLAFFCLSVDFDISIAASDSFTPIWKGF